MMLERLEEAIAAIPQAGAEEVRVEEVPLLFGPSAEAVIERAARLVAPLAEKVAQSEVPARLAEECRALLAAKPDPGRLIRAAVDGGASGVEGFLAWKAISRALPPIDASKWSRSSCPGCGALPAMAELREGKRGRERVLVCGRCAVRWPYRRLGCPYCGNDDLQKLSVLEPDDEGFRVDVCRECDGYLKVYVGEGGAAHALSDWSTLHLDAACRDRGLQRPSPSLYGL